MNEALAVIRNMDQLINVLAARRDELQLTHATLDSIQGCADGYTSKIFAGMKNLGPKSFGEILQALGLAVVVVKDPASIERASKRWVTRKRPQKLNQPQVSIAPEIRITPDLQAQIEAVNGTNGQLSMKQIWGSMGGKRRAKRLKKRVRQQIATHAARKRWDRAKSASAS